MLTAAQKQEIARKVQAEYAATGPRVPSLEKLLPRIDRVAARMARAQAVERRA